MNNKISKFYFIGYKVEPMNNTEILLSNNTSNEEKCEAAKNIVINYELSLSVEQILLAHEKTLDWINEKKSKKCTKNRIFLFNETLNIYKNMYNAIILALCNNFKLENLWYFLILNEDGVPIDVGINNRHYDTSINKYCNLLDYCEFDVSSIKCISNEDKQIIQTYRAEKYAGKSTKCAKK